MTLAGQDQLFIRSASLSQIRSKCQNETALTPESGPFRSRLGIETGSIGFSRLHMSWRFAAAKLALPETVHKSMFKLLNQGHRIKIGGLGRMANPTFRENLGFCGTFSHISTMFMVALVIVNKYNVYVQ